MHGGRRLEANKRRRLPGWRWLAVAPAIGWAGAGLTAAQTPPAPQPTEAELRQALLAEAERARLVRERQAQMVAARRKLQEQDYAAAVAMLQPLLAAQPEAGLYLELGQAQIGLQQFGPARRSLTEALDLDAGLMPAKRGLGWLAFREQDYSGALKWWEPLLQGGQRDSELLERAGQCYYFTQQRRAALACFEAAALGRPDDRDLDRWRIFCAQDIGEFEQADRLARGYLAARSGDAAVRRIAAHSAAALQRREDAILQLERLHLDGQMTRADWLLLCDLYALAGDDSRAADCLEAAGPATGAGATGQSTAADWLRLGQLQERAGRSARAAECYRAVAADSPEAAAAALGLARLALARREAAVVLTQCRAALAARPDLADAQLLMGTAFEQLGQTAEAAAAYEQAAATPRLAADAYLGLARLAYLRNDLGTALRHYRAAAEIQPTDAALQGIVRQLELHLTAAVEP